MFIFLVGALPAVIARRKGFYLAWSDIEPFFICLLLGALFTGVIEFLIYLVRFMISLYRLFAKRGE